MINRIRIGTRGSKLALWQAYYAEKLLNNHGLDTKIITFDTKGDKYLDVSIAKIGSKGVFTEELENALREDVIDIAAHSAKDLSSVLPEEFEILAFTEREKPHDVLISNRDDINFRNPDFKLVGTSSTRRIALLKHYYPHIRDIAVRGNLETRIRKMEEGQCDGLLVAYAGVHRMGYDHLIRENLDMEKFTPPAGQGSIAIECHEKISSEKKKVIRMCINHKPTWDLLVAERAFLRKLEGGCSIPSFCLAQFKENGEIAIRGGLISLDGKNICRKMVTGPPDNTENLGIQLANIVLESGGKEILVQIKKQLGRI